MSSSVYMKQWTNDFRTKRKSFAIEYLGGTCMRCGSVNDLEFDHIDPSTKVMVISKMWTSSREKFMEELKKCQLLCHSCHLEKSRKEGSLFHPWNRGKKTHGPAYISHKCRCDICKQWQRERAQKYRKAKIVS